MNQDIPLRSVPAWVRIASAAIPMLPAGRYRAIARLCANPPKPFLMNLPAKLGGYSYICDLGDIMSQEICFTGRFEAQETALFRAILKPGMTFVDVGANWGYFSLLAASLVGPEGNVISFEPDPRVHRLLKSNIERNRLAHVRPLEIAASQDEGALTLAGYSEDSNNFGVSRVVEGKTGECPGGAFTVAARRVDDVLDELKVEKVDLLKMDIEGAEVFALRGIREGLARARYRRLILELHPGFLAEHGQTAQEAFDIVKQAGYRAWRVDHAPATTRRVAYLAEPNLKELLQPIESASVLDSWPHLLWLAPGVEPVA